MYRWHDELENAHWLAVKFALHRVAQKLRETEVTGGGDTAGSTRCHALESELSRAHAALELLKAKSDGAYLDLRRKYERLKGRYVDLQAREGDLRLKLADVENFLKSDRGVLLRDLEDGLARSKLAAASAEAARDDLEVELSRCLCGRGGSRSGRDARNATLDGEKPVSADGSSGSGGNGSAATAAAASSSAGAEPADARASRETTAAATEKATQLALELSRIKLELAVTKAEKDELELEVVQRAEKRVEMTPKHRGKGRVRGWSPQPPSLRTGGTGG